MKQYLLTAVICTLTLTACHAAPETGSAPDPIAKPYLTVNNTPIPQF